jgi:branched-chain amino acid transport system substrate-binding protein
MATADPTLIHERGDNMFLRRSLLMVLACLAAGPLCAQTKKPVRIGAIYPLTGSASFLGIPEERALRMKVDEINKTGGVNGHMLEVIVYDTEGNGTKAVQQLRRLIESDNVDVVFGPSSSGEALQTIDIVNESKVPQIAHGGTETLVRPTKPYVFNSVPTDRVAISYMLSYFKKKGYKTIAFMGSADGYGQSGKNVLQSLLADYGMKIATAEEFNRQDPDMTAQVLRARQSGADAMLVWSALPAPTIIARNAHAVGYDKPIFVGYGAASNDLVEKAGPAAEGLYISSFRLLAPGSLSNSDPVRPVTMKLYADYLARYKEPPANFAQHSHDAVAILEAALKQVKDPVTRDSLRDAIEKVNVIGANGHFKFSSTDHGGLDSSSNPLVMLRYVQGKWQIAQ